MLREKNNNYMKILMLVPSIGKTGVATLIAEIGNFNVFFLRKSA
jgi:hypothetical protein